MRAASDGYGLDYLYLPVSKETKQDVEEQQLEWLNSQNVELVILARYMQVLSSSFLDQVRCPVINIHHSFAALFCGSQALPSGIPTGCVKLIGATAHYVTEDLDEGPIIEQDVTRVSHRHGPSNLIEKGRDLENGSFLCRPQAFTEPGFGLWQ